MFPFRDHNPSRRTPYVTIALILANVVVFLLMLPGQDDPFTRGLVLARFALFPALIAEGEGYFRLISAAFMHAGIWHLAGNMLFLWVFGDNMEDHFGHVPFALFYAGCAVLSGLAHVASDPGSIVPMVGASGAVAGIMGGYLLLFPRARIDVFFFFVVFFRIIPIRAWLVLGVWLAFQIFNGTGTQVDNVAYWAHIGGFLAGLGLTVPFWLSNGGPAFWRRVDGHPPHPETQYGRSSIPVVMRRRR